MKGYAFANDDYIIIMSHSQSTRRHEPEDERGETSDVGDGEEDAEIFDDDDQ